MESLFFTISEFIKVPNSLTAEVADKILRYHIWVLNPVREKLGMPLYVSQHSGYRPVEYELSKGRSGNSEHTFKGRGAVDLTCGDMHLLRELLFTDSGYSRIAWYPGKGFIHCDYLNYDAGIRKYYEADANSDVWVFKFKIT